MCRHACASVQTRFCRGAMAPEALGSHIGPILKKEASSPEVGSSRKMSLGAPMRPQAMLSRRCSPPEIPRTRRPPGSRPPTCRVHLGPQERAARACLPRLMSKHGGCSQAASTQSAACRRGSMTAPGAQRVCLCRHLKPSMSMTGGIEQLGASRRQADCQDATHACKDNVWAAEGVRAPVSGAL